MASPQIVDGGDALQIWRVAANMLNNQSWTADIGWFSSFGVGCWANSSSPQKIVLLRNITQNLGLERILWKNNMS
jgi:hypothetical protein